MKRRSFFLSCAALLGLGVPAAKAVAEGPSSCASFAPFLCPECGNRTLVPGPINEDIFKCDCCGATPTALEVIRAIPRGPPNYKRISYPDPEGFQYYSGYDPINVGSLTRDDLLK